MAGPRKGESNANFLRRVNKSLGPDSQISQSDIQDFDEYDRQHARDRAYFYLKNGQNLPDFMANDPTFQKMRLKDDMGRSAENLPAGKMDALMQFMQGRGDEMEIPDAKAFQGPQGPDMNGIMQWINSRDMPGVSEELRGLAANAALEYLGNTPERDTREGLEANFNKLVNRMSPGERAERKAKGYNMKFGEPAQLPVDENGVVAVLDSDDAIHYERMDGGDTNIAYTEPGEMVLPKAVGDRHPRVREAIAEAIRFEGGDEQQYIAGNPKGNYDEVTGAQKFSWYDKLVDIGDYVANKPWAQSTLTGLTTAGIGKLSGQDTKTALYTGLGAGLGSYAGRGIGNMLETTTETEARKAKPEYNTLKGKDEGYEATLDDVKASLKQALSNTVGNRAANYGATAGLTLGQQMAPPPKNNYTAPNMPAPTIPSIVDNEYYDQFKPNQQANISATIPQPNPVAPMNMSYLPEGVTYQDKVRDRETGGYNYQNSSRQDQSAFARAIAGTTARRGRGFGNMILV